MEEIKPETTESAKPENKKKSKKLCYVAYLSNYEDELEEAYRKKDYD